MASPRFALILLLCNTALSFPVDLQKVFKSVDPPSKTCHSIDTFTTDWFLGNTKDVYRKEIRGKALFYSRGASENAQRLACGSNNYVSIWEIWPEWLYNSEVTVDNPMSCIHNGPMKRTFYENMSKAYARMARDTATVMHMTADYANPPQDGIWGRIEVPALRDLTDITEMTKIDEYGRRPTKWSIPNKCMDDGVVAAMYQVRRIFDSTRNALSRRSSTATVNGEACPMWAAKEARFLDSL